MKVNMTPNPLDVVTIHASQGDTEAREWEFELHNNGELIDTSEITEQLFFKAYKGGTEQILPENTSTPTTSPFKGDIRYPQGLLTDQEFTYRQSPTEEDGLAKITDIKGNTLVWNQLVQNGNFADTSAWYSWGTGATSIGIANNELTLTNLTADQYYKYSLRQDIDYTRLLGHKLLVAMDLKASASFEVRLILTTNVLMQMDATTNYTRFAKIYSYNSANTPAESYIGINPRTLEIGSYIKLKNVMFVDLTQLFGSGNEPTSVDEFTSLFPLPFYDFNQGTLIPFSGNGIKTVGKNLLNVRTTQINNGITFTNDNGVISINGTATANAFFVTNIGLRNGSYFIGAFNDEINNSVHIAVQNKSGAYVLDVVMGEKNIIRSLNNDINNFIIWVNNGTTLTNFVLKPMLSFESPEYFEPYTSSTLSLPISTYFPNGMKSAGTVYDELTETKAITRIGSADLGSLEWTSANTSTQGISRMRTSSLGNVISKPSYVSIKANVICANYATLTANNTYTKNSGISVDNAGDILVYDPNYNTSDKVSAFKTAMSGVYLYYELATPTETEFTTASLVTENGEIPLSNEDGILIGKCTEQLSAEPGFHNAKIKLADADGECYSNKIQLHIERSPQ